MFNARQTREIRPSSAYVPSPSGTLERSTAKRTAKRTAKGLQRSAEKIAKIEESSRCLQLVTLDPRIPPEDGGRVLVDIPDRESRVERV
jgi:hypothetical protein